MSRSCSIGCSMGRGGPPIVLRANPDRIWAAEQALAEYPEIAVFLLDDAFQHRRVARTLDIVLLSATEPFDSAMFCRAGCWREPVSGLGPRGRRGDYACRSSRRNRFENDRAVCSEIQCRRPDLSRDPCTDRIAVGRRLVRFAS